MTVAQALWITAKQQAACQTTTYQVDAGNLEVQTLYTGISRGTERLVYSGQVPPDEYATMRAPFQEGEFPFPVKYGYSAVGQIQNGDNTGALVFACRTF